MNMNMAFAKCISPHHPNPWPCSTPWRLWANVAEKNCLGDTDHQSRVFNQFPEVWILLLYSDGVPRDGSEVIEVR